MSIHTALILFLVFALVIALAGFRLVRYADKLADITGIGEALFGAILLGAITSLAGITTSVTAATQNYPQLAISNAMGGIAAQTFFLALADLVYRKANLEHASASLTNLLQGLLLIFMLSFVMLVVYSPEVSIWGIHPASVLLLLIYFFGTRLIDKAKNAPMWYPLTTKETVKDVPEQENIRSTNVRALWVKFVLLALVVGFSGYVVARTGIVIASSTGMSEGLVGSLFTAIVTSFPELIVTIAATRQRALTLAVGNIIGGNTFDILFVSFSDFAYRPGSIFHAIGQEQIYVIVITLIMVATLIGGLLIRERQGIGKIGWESALIILFFVMGYLILYL